VFTTFIVQPIFNLLVLIYNLIPGHNFGLAIIIFTVIVRFCLWPLVKKQLHQTKLIRRIQPDLKRIKAAAKGDRQKEAVMMMELYKERGIKPLRSIGLILLQAPILIGLYLGLQRLVKDPHELINFAYPAIRELSWMQQVAADIGKFDETLFGLIDLTRAAIGPQGFYWPALLLVLGSAVAQFFQSKQLMPQDKDARSLRGIMKDAGAGKQADQSEMQAAVTRSTLYFLPAIIFCVSVTLASALSLYWLVGSLVAFVQQTIALRDDAEEMDKMADAPLRSARGSKGLRSSRDAKSDVPAAESTNDEIDNEADDQVLEGEVINNGSDATDAASRAARKRRKAGKAKKKRR
jgi:YidC/Oxa1 family membrane protein insertase